MSNSSDSGQSAGGKPLFSLGGSAATNKDESASATKPSFGTFGSTPSTTKNLFGGFGSSNQNANSSPFTLGGGQNTASGGLSFGTPKTDENKPANPSPFGSFSTPNKPPSSSGPTQSLSMFGNTGTSSSSNAFGAPAAATPTTSKTLPSFGNLSTTPAGPPPASSGGFLSLGTASKSGPSLFGNTSTGQTTNETSTTSSSTSNIFGGQTQQPSNTPATSSAGLFGSSNASRTAGSGLFGNQSTQAQGSNLFGKPATDNKAPEPPKPSLFSMSSFGNANTTANNASTSVAAAEAAKTPDQTSFKPPFSLPAATSQNNLSSGQSPTTSTGPSLFSKPASTSSGQSATTTTGPSLFGKPTSTSAPSTNAFAGFGQKTDAPNSSAAPAPSLFAPKKDTPAPVASGNNLFAKLGENKDNAVPAASGSTPFSGFAPKKDTTDSSTKPQETNAPAAITTAAPKSLGAAPPLSFGAPDKPAATASTSLFGSTSKPTDSASGATQTGTATQASGSSALGASTAGPGPGAQSRLKNKSMDEIITRWATDLSKYQKEFQAQAEKVASWDRMLLENGNAISKLYSKAFQAERDTAEVQKQLSAVEGNQEELSMWLDRYEREVDEMMARQVGQGEGLQGPDQERERTYKIAERVSDRLSEMGKELTTVIEEINEASAAISKTSKADDPLSQIVRVLNGHLSQLQVIDQSTSALQGKVIAAQKESQRLGSRSHGGLGSDSGVDDFYRSYTRRG